MALTLYVDHLIQIIVFQCISKGQAKGDAEGGKDQHNEYFLSLC